MDIFTGDIYSIFELIDNNDESKTFMHIKTISKQYLAYYVYRVITKYMKFVELSQSSGDIDDFLTYLRVPTSHNRLMNYPFAGKFTNDEKILDMIILKGIDLLTKTDTYIKTLPTKTYAHDELYVFLKQKELTVIIQDLIDLQTLLPGLSVPAIRQNYINNSKI